MKVPLVGCASHRFNLAVQQHLNPEYTALLLKINSLMTKLKTLKLSGKLRKLTPLRPVCSNKTRWSSVFTMVKRYKEIACHIKDLGDTDLLDYYLSHREEIMLASLVQDLEKFQSVTLALQREELSMKDMRLLFDGVCELFPRFNNHLAYDATIVHSPDFESAVTKLAGKKEENLTEREICAVKGFVVESGAQNPVPQEFDFASSILKKPRVSPGYSSVRHILPTSNLVERFFSQAAVALGDYRERLSPVNLESQLFLKFNRNYWNLNDVNKIA